MLYIIYGFPGSGKTSLAYFLQKEIPRSFVFSNDRLKMHCFQKKSVISTCDLYAKLARLACKAIRLGYSVIIDATFYKEFYQDVFFDIILKESFFESSEIISIRIIANVATCRKRILCRKANSSQFSGLNYLPKFETVCNQFFDLQKKYTRYMNATAMIDNNDFYSDLNWLSSHLSSRREKEIVDVFKKARKRIGAL